MKPPALATVPLCATTTYLAVEQVGTHVDRFILLCEVVAFTTCGGGYLVRGFPGREGVGIAWSRAQFARAGKVTLQYPQEQLRIRAHTRALGKFE
jgi:hypothetical protein